MSAADDSQEDLLVEVIDGIGHMRLNRPAARNALSDEMKARLHQATSDFASDPAVRAVLVTAAGDHFMVGADVRQFHRELTENRDAHVAGFEARVLETARILDRLRAVPKPVLLAAQGQTVGFGFCLAAAADLVIAADDAQFMLAYCHIGLSPDAGVTWTLPRIVGERRAKQIAFLGEKIDAATACDWGFVNQVVPREQLDAAAWALARRLANAATLSLAGSKQLIGKAFERNWPDQLRGEAARIADVVSSDDHLEGVSAFVEKRPPLFRGR